MEQKQLMFQLNLINMIHHLKVQDYTILNQEVDTHISTLTTWIYSSKSELTQLNQENIIYMVLSTYHLIHPVLSVVSQDYSLVMFKFTQVLT